MRVNINVSERQGDSWFVDVESANGAAIGQRREITATQITLGPQDFWLPTLIGTQGIGQLSGVFERIRSRAINRGDVEAFGSHLFDVLIGSASMAAIRAANADDLVELRILLPTTETALSDLPWEMMFDTSVRHHLAEMTNPIVAVTRAVSSTAQPAVMVGLPRVLYAIGSSVSDPVVRPGLEIMGMLRRSNEDRGMTTSVLQGASVERLRNRVGRFRPDVVHIISHGTPTAIELATEDDVSGTLAERERVDAARLVYAITPDDGSPPSAVVLSACDTMTSLQHVPSLAAKLVEQGVPVVIGVGGKISDQGCRLFMRKFSDALLDGSPLVKALAFGRTAALRGGGPTAYAANHLDWALPTLVLSSAIVEPDFGVIDTDLVNRIMAPIGHFGMGRLKLPPVFCGRHEFLDRFEDLIDPSHALRALGAVMVGNANGVGDKRLLDEFSARAIRERHIPCRLVSWTHGQRKPKTAAQLAGRCAQAVLETLDAFVDPGERQFVPWPGFADLLAEAGSGDLGDEPTRSKVDRALNDLIAMEPHDVGGNVDNLRLIVADLFDELRRAVIASCPHMSEGAQVVLLVSEVQDMDKAATALFRWIENPLGLGVGRVPVSVAFSCSLTNDVTDHLRPLLEGANSAHGVHVLPLSAFSGEEEFVAYQWALMNPWGDSDRSSVSYCARNSGEDALWRNEFRNKFQGLPGKFTDPTFHDFAWYMSDRWMTGDSHLFVVGEDNLWLSQVDDGKP